MNTQVNLKAALSSGRGKRFSPATLAFILLVGLVVVGFLLGGSSRGDTISLLLLRPLSFAILGYALWTEAEWRRDGVPLPFWLLVGLAIWAAVQLVPLPPSLWHGLPGREIVQQTDAQMLAADPWRPISMAPSRTLNALFSLAAPLAAMLLFARLDGQARIRVALLLVALGGASALLSLLQVIGPERSALYLYRITNEGMAVGLFANRNHNAVFLAALIPLVTGLYLHHRQDGSMLLRAALVAAALFFVPVVFATGSRTGSLLLGLGLIGSLALYVLGGGRLSFPASGRVPAWFTRTALVLVPLALAAVGYLFATSAAYDRFFARSFADELRWQVLPQLQDMVLAYFPVGSGFGSFYLVYRIDEPDRLLSTRYLNQAHNDLIQPVIEGGLPAAILMVAFAAWLGWRGLKAWRELRSERTPTLWPYAWLSLVLLLAGSASDYPLRTPAAMLAAAILVCLVGNLGASGTRIARKS